MIGKRLRALRMAKGFTQGQLALRSGVPQYTISRLELGKTRSVELTVGIALAQALGEPVEALTARPYREAPRGE